MPTTTGAYGLRVEGIDAGSALCIEGGEDWPVVHVVQEIDPGPYPTDPGITEDAAWVQTPAAHLTMDRAGRRVIARAPVAVPQTDLVHPGLWPAASVFARWRGAETLHGGAVVDQDGGAWAILGDRGGGKSSLLASFALGGDEVVADDLLVIEGASCCAGPRCVDLRPETVERLEIESRTTPVRSTERRRLALPPVRAQLPLHGFVFLAWGHELVATRLAPGETLGLLVAHRRVAVLGFSVDHMLDLAALPAIRLVRPLEWELQDAGCKALRDAMARHRDGGQRGIRR